MVNGLDQRDLSLPEKIFRRELKRRTLTPMLKTRGVASYAAEGRPLIVTWVEGSASCDGMFAQFFKSANPFKVKVGEQTLMENEVSLITETEDRVISPSLQTISLVDHTIQNEQNVNSSKRKKGVASISGSSPMKKARTEGIVIYDSRPNTAGKFHTALRRLIRQGKQAVAGSRSAVPAMKDVTSSSVTPTLERALEDALHNNVVSLVSSSQASVSVPVTESTGNGRPLSAPDLETGTLFATPSQDSSADDFYESQTVDSATAMSVYVPNWNVTNNARVDSLVICHSFLNHVISPGYWAALHNQGDVGFLDASNTNPAQHICMASELRLHYEHEIMTREKFERKFTHCIAIVQQRDAEVGEAASLTTQNVGLLEKVFALELEHDSLKGQDSPLVLIMYALILKDDQDREMLLSDVIPAIRQSAERKGLCLPSSSALGLTNPPHVVHAHDDLFDTSVLDKPGDVSCFWLMVFEPILTMVLRTANHLVKLF
nr:hypothetical protein [Tanacetum cinerariifolium]